MNLRPSEFTPAPQPLGHAASFSLRKIRLVDSIFCCHITIQVKGTFRARWLASSEVISQSLFTSEQPKEKQNWLPVGVLSNKVTFWSSSYSTCVVNTKTIIHLSVAGRGGYLPPLWWLIVNYHHHHYHHHRYHYYLYHYYYYYHHYIITVITITIISLLLSLQLLFFYHDFLSDSIPNFLSVVQTVRASLFSRTLSFILPICWRLYCLFKCRMLPLKT